MEENVHLFETNNKEIKKRIRKELELTNLDYDEVKYSNNITVFEVITIHSEIMYKVIKKLQYTLNREN